MKVALVSPYAWDRPGGVQSHIRSLATELRRREHETLVIAPAIRRLNETENVARAGLAVGIPANGSVAPIAFGPIAAAALRRALRAFRPEVLHLHEPLIPSVSLLALMGRPQVPVVGTFHAAANKSAGYRVGRAVLDRAARRLTLRTAVSEAARDLVSRYFPGDYSITPNGVEVERFASAQPLGLAGRKKVLFFGRIERRKGLDLLLEAMAQLHDPDVRLVVGGDGPQVQGTRTKAEALGIRAEFLGRVVEEDVAGLYRAADVYVAPNLRGESFGIVLLEAMAAGVPVVCSDLPGFRSAVGDAALLVPPGDAVALAAAIRTALGDRHEDLSRRSRERAQAFDWSVLAPGIEALYERALGVGTA